MDKGSAAKIIHPIFVTEAEATANRVEIRFGREWHEESATSLCQSLKSGHGYTLGFENSPQESSHFHRGVGKKHDRTAFDELRIRRLGK
jgi:hypothetical protein